MVVEQMVLDGGRVQVGWVMGGMPESCFSSSTGSKDIPPSPSLCLRAEGHETHRQSSAGDGPNKKSTFLEKGLPPSLSLPLSA